MSAPGAPINQYHNTTLQAMQEVRQDLLQELSAERLTSLKALQADLTTEQPPWMKRQGAFKKKLKERRTKIQKFVEAGEKKKRISPLEMRKNSADEFEKRNPELKAKTLVALREYIKPTDSPKKILEKLREFYQDPTLANEALDFLLETTEGALNQAVREAKSLYEKSHKREILAGQNIKQAVKEAVEKGTDKPQSLRAMYYDITGNPRDSRVLFRELSGKYQYEELKKVVKFLLHSLGIDMKSKGPSISRGMLHRLMSETRNLQAILGVYRFFKGRMPLIEKLMMENGLPTPQKLNFESISKQFMNLVSDTYPTADKVFQLAKPLGIDRSVLSEIIIFSQMRDGVKEMSKDKIYQSIEHRNQVFHAIIEALEELEDELEEIEDEIETKKEDL